MKQNFSQWLSSLLKPERRQHPVSLLIAAIALLSGVTGWSQCTTAPPIAGASNITATTAKLNWSIPADATSPTYTVEVSTSSTFATLFASQTALNSTSYAVNGLTNGTTYYFRVKVDNTTCGDFGTGNFIAQLGYTPIDVTGFNADVIANGVGPAASTSTHTVDSPTANNAYLSRDYKPLPASPALTFGLPVDRALSSANPTGLKYILQDYSQNNSLRLPNTNNNGTLVFSEPQKLMNLYIAAASGDGASTISIEVLFSDGGPSQIVTGQTVTNWDTTPTAPITTIINSIGRVNRGDNVTSAASNNFKIFQIIVNIDAANQNRLVSGVKITKTDTNSTDTKIPNIFAVSGRSTPVCPILNTPPTGAGASLTSATFSWSVFHDGSAAIQSYTLEVYTDASFTTAISGSPFTGITGTSYTVPGLTAGVPYFFRVKANNGVCESDYVNSTYTLAYCTPTSTSGTANTISNLTTTGGYTNFNNTTSTGSYNDYYATQSVSKPAGTTFSFNGTKVTGSTRVYIFVDWNKDFDFDDLGETVYSLGSSSATTFNGTITIPAGTPIGDYRMRIRTASASTTVSVTPCGNMSNGEAEDYKISVVAPPADCPAPDPAAGITVNTTGYAVAVSITPAATTPTGYILIRSTSPTGNEPSTGVNYAVGSMVGTNGMVLAMGPTLTSYNDFIGANTRYYYSVYTYNETGSITCFNPKFSTPATANTIACAKAVVNASASNINANSATLNWSSIVGPGGDGATYTIEVYTDAGLTTLFGSYTTSNNSFNLTNLPIGTTTYYYRVKGATTGCHNDAWSGVSSFVAQNSFTPLNLTGYNADVIANGTGVARGSTSNAVDAVNFSYLSLDYERSNGAFPTQGLPVNRTLPVTTPAVRFLLGDYSNNNTLRLASQNQTGTLTLTKPVKATDIYVAVTGGSGAPTATAKINFSDGTNQTATISVPDWFATTTVNQVIVNIGRVTRENLVGNPETGAKIFYAPITLSTLNQAKTVTSVEFTKTSAGLTEPVANIFGISAKLVEDCATLATVGSLPAATTAEVNWTTGTGAPATTTYTLEVYTDAAFTTPIAGSPFTGITTLSYNLTGLTSSTHYYFRVKAVNTNCTSPYSTGDFTTTCQVFPPTANAQQFCTASTVANLTATGTTGATFNWYADATSTTPLASTATITTGTYYVTQTVGTCESGKTSVNVTVTILNAPTAAAQTFCAGATVSQIVVTGATGATFAWSTTENGTALAGTTALASGTYYVKQTVGTCTSASTSVVITVNTVNAPTANTSQTFCSGATVAQLTATGATGATLTWSATQGGPALTGTTALVTGTYFVTQTVNTCTSPATSVNVVVNNTPAPTSATLAYCGVTTVANLVANGGTGATFKWYNSVTAVTPLVATANVTSGTYFVSQTINSCEGPRLSVNITVTNLSAPTAAATQTHCNNATVAQLSVSGTAGATFVWSLTENGTALASTEPLTAGTYYVKQTLNSCTSTSTSVVVTLTSVNAPTAATQTLCAGSTVSQLSATGEVGATFSWSLAPNGQPLANATVLTQGTYYVKQTVGSCTSTATAVTVNITTTPVPTANTQVVCAGSTVAVLSATGVAGATFTWYATQDGTPLASNTALTAGTYFVTQTDNSCESAKVPVTVTINTIPAPTAAAQSHCNGSTVTQLVAAGQAGATFTWSLTEDGPALAETTQLSAGTYFVRQSVNGCESTATSVTVTITTVAAPTTTELTFCPGATATQLTATVLPGAIVKWYATEGGPQLTGTEVLATGTYYVSQTLNGCESSLATVNVTVNNVPAPTADAGQQICQGSSVSEIAATGVEGATLVWYTSINGNPINSATMAVTGIYYVSQSLNGCMSPKTAITVTISPVPGPPTGASTQIFSEGETITDLDITTVAGATTTWYVLENGEYVAVNTTTELVDGETYYVSQSLNTCESELLAITVSFVSGRDDFNTKDIKVFPNPTRDVMTVTNSNIINRVTVVNLLGQTVIDQSVNSDNVQVDLSNLAGGNYILQVQSEGATATIKVIKY